MADHLEYVERICREARDASRIMSKLTTVEKNNLLYKIASRLRERSDYIIQENSRDISSAESAGLTKAMIDRLLLNEERIGTMAKSVEEIAAFEDPIGVIENMKTRPSGISVGKMRVPIGVVGVIYESRPNVTTDIAALCIKSGNASVLRGGKESIHSNTALYNIIKEALSSLSYHEAAVTFVEKTEREIVQHLLKMDHLIDIVIPRGGEGLIRMVTENSTIPVVKHDKGLCHLYIDDSAEKDMAVSIAVNAKTQRPGVCNAIEALLIHKDFKFPKDILSVLIDNGVELRGCGRTQDLMKDKVVPATEEDFNTEYLDLILSVKIVDSMAEAMDHITQYSSGHSEAIVTSDYANGQKFVKEVDSSAVFINSSTRFHDGGEFGLGAEVGISTQKLHARGAMGVEGLTTQKYIIYGNGEIR